MTKRTKWSLFLAFSVFVGLVAFAATRFARAQDTMPVPSGWVCMPVLDGWTPPADATSAALRNGEMVVSWPQTPAHPAGVAFVRMP